MHRLGKYKANTFTKTSKDGKPYKQIAFTQSDKQQDGTYKETTMFMFEGDAAVAVAVLQAALSESTHYAPKEKATDPGWDSPPPSDDLNDDVPF